MAGLTTPSYNPGQFTNPQRIIDDSFDTFVEGGQKMVNKIATSAEQIYARNKAEKASQKIEWEKQNEEQQKLYSKVNELGSTGSSSLDNNLRGFWDGRVDDYFKIKNAMQRGDMEQQEGNRLLASINGEVNKFKTVVPYLASQVTLQQEAGKLDPGTAGAVSSVTSTESQQVLNNLMTGGNTGLVSRGGNMFLYNPAIKGQQQGGMLNIDELIANQSTGKSIVQTVPDISKDLTGAFQGIFKPDDVASELVEFKKETKEGYDYTYKTISEDNKVKGIEEMKSTGMFNPLLKDEKMMTSVWQDMIPDDYLEANGVNPDSSWMMMDPAVTDPKIQQANQDKQREIATNWLAEKAYNDNSEMDQGALKYVNKQKTPAPKQYEAPTPVDPLKNYSAKAKAEIRNGEGRYNTVITDINTFYETNPEPDAQSVVDQINNTQQVAGGDAQNWWVADGETEGEIEGMIYSTGDRRGFKPEYFHTQRNLENAALGNLFKEQGTIDHFREKNKTAGSHTFATRAEYNDAVSKGTVKPGDSVSITNDPTPAHNISFIQP